MRVTRSLRAVAVATLLCFAATGCMSISPVNVPPRDQTTYPLRIKPGRTVVAKLRDGTVHRFELVRQEPDALVGKDVRVPLADIAELKVERISVGKTTLLGGLGGVVVFVLLLSTI